MVCIRLSPWNLDEWWPHIGVAGRVLQVQLLGFWRIGEALMKERDGTRPIR